MSDLQKASTTVVGPPAGSFRPPLPVPSLEIRPPRPVPELPVADVIPRARSGKWIVEWILVLVLALVLALGVRSYVAQMFFIPSGSMLPTLQIGDRIVVDKLSYHLHAVHRGDIVVFRRPPLEQAPYADLVKRVIGLPGDTIAAVDGRVYIDGKPLQEPWLPKPNPMTTPSPLPNGFSLHHPYTVPPGQYYVMGDNRTDSEDSRYFGPIAGNLIVGKMMFVAWPLDEIGWVVVLTLVAGAVALVSVLAVLTGKRERGRSLAGPAPASEVIW